MSDILAGEVFTDTGEGANVTAERLNNFLGGAAIQKEFVTGQSIATPATGDYLLLNDVSANGLARATIATVVATVALTDQAAGVASMRTLSTTATSAAAGNDTRFPASVTGIRKGAGAGSADTAALTPDFAQAPTAIVLTVGVGAADCSLNTNFTCALPTSITSCTITFNNVPNGAMIRLITTQGSSSASTSVTLVYNSGNGSGALTQKRAGGAGTVTNATNAIDKISALRAGSNMLLDFGNAYA